MVFDYNLGFWTTLSRICSVSKRASEDQLFSSVIGRITLPSPYHLFAPIPRWDSNSMDLQFLLPLPSSIQSRRQCQQRLHRLVSFPPARTCAWWLLYHTVITVIWSMVRFAVSDSSPLSMVVEITFMSPIQITKWTTMDNSYLCQSWFQNEEPIGRCDYFFSVNWRWCFLVLRSA